MKNDRLAGLVTQLYELHQTRRHMSHASIYHGTYEKMAIELNAKIQEEIGVSYSDIPSKMRDFLIKKGRAARKN